MSTRVLRPEFEVTPALLERFNSKWVRADEADCWIWTGSVSKGTGYGAFKLNGRKVDAHVAAWRISNNGAAVPIGQLVMHSCDCRQCVNPDHLSLGTSSENMRDASERGDVVIASAKLTEQQVPMIRRLHSEGWSMYAIAKLVGVSDVTIASLIHGKTWKHV